MAQNRTRIVENFDRAKKPVKKRAFRVIITTAEDPYI